MWCIFKTENVSYQTWITSYDAGKYRTHKKQENIILDKCKVQKSNPECSKLEILKSKEEEFKNIQISL